MAGLAGGGSRASWFVGSGWWRVIVHGQWAVIVVGGGCELVMVVGGGGVVLWSSRHVADGDMAPASCVSKGRGRVRWLTCIHVDSDDDLRRHCLDDMARLLTCQVIFKPSKRSADVASCCRSLSSFVDRAGDVALPRCSRHWGG